MYRKSDAEVIFEEGPVVKDFLYCVEIFSGDVGVCQNVSYVRGVCEDVKMGVSNVFLVYP